MRRLPVQNTIKHDPSDDMSSAWIDSRNAINAKDVCPELAIHVLQLIHHLHLPARICDSSPAFDFERLRIEEEEIGATVGDDKLLPVVLEPPSVIKRRLEVRRIQAQ